MLFRMQSNTPFRMFLLLTVPVGFVRAAMRFNFENCYKSRFAWIGEIETEQLLTALETLKTEDLEIITMYAYDGYDITEISKVYGASRPTISIKIKRIAKFLKKLQFQCYELTFLVGYQVRGQFTRWHRPLSRMTAHMNLES